MAEEEQPKGQPPITRLQFMRFLDGCGVDRKCPCCGADDWEVLNEEGVEGVAMARLGGDALVYPDSILPAIVLVCDNCAYLWLVARKRVAMWLAQYPEGTP